MPHSDLEQLLDGAITEGWFPSYQALIVDAGETLFTRARGLAVIEPEAVPASEDTLYDLASLTKPLVTAVVALRLAEEGVLPLTTPAYHFLPELSEPPRHQITVLDLLTHRAGFAPWAPLYLDNPPSLARFARAAIRLQPANPPRADVVYSDLGYIVLGAVLEVVSGRPFVELAEKAVPSGRSHGELLFNPPAELRPRIAATERGNEHERMMAGAAAGDRRFRSAILWGEVHDGNAHGLGGVAPHAGLFGNARAVARVAAAFFPHGPLLGDAGRAPAVVHLSGPIGAPRTAAFEIAAGPGTAATGVLPDDAVGHTGFTGTSLWLEPRRQRLYVLLTNRVHPRVGSRNMNEFRRRFHRLAATL